MLKVKIGEAVRDLREANSLSQAELAEKARVRVDTLRKLELGKGTSRANTVRSVAKALGVAPSYLRERAQQLKADAQRSAAAQPLHGIQSDPLFLRLRQATRITSARTNIVRDETQLPIITLRENLYVRRDVEDEINRLLSDPNTDVRLMVIEGEPGTGKSSLLWAAQQWLTDEGRDAWLIDAAELSFLFGSGNGDGPILSQDFRALFGRIIEAGRKPVLLIDTIDVLLNTMGKDGYIAALLSELMVTGLGVIVASRPGEARQLHVFEPRVIHLLDYSDGEFPKAVEAYASAFVRDGGKIDHAEHARNLLNAAAQGYPIKEICRNPLTLRMLYSVYAPEQINVFEIDVVSLYTSFWQRRVESDLRTDAKTRPASDVDLTQCALRVATCMLAESLPELPWALLAQELRSRGIGTAELALLEGRGVLRVSKLGSAKLVSFFHQTFFEHAAALAILRLGGDTALRALAQRWAYYNGNLFLGAILERALVLSEHEVNAVRKESEIVMRNLIGQGPAGLSVLAYVFVHRATVPGEVTKCMHEQVIQKDALVVERLLGIGGNAGTTGRSALLQLIQPVLQSRNGRWIRRALELLGRFSSSNMDDVIAILKRSGVGEMLVGGEFPQSRDIFVDFLADAYRRDPDWALGELARQFADAFRRRAEEVALRVLTLLGTYANADPALATKFERLAGIDRGDAVEIRTSEEVAGLFGRLFFEEWKRARTLPAQIVQDVDHQKHRGLSLTSRLNGLVFLLLQASPDEAVEAFRRSGLTTDATVRINLARITWTRFFLLMSRQWERKACEYVIDRIGELAGDVFEDGRGPHADLLFHVIRQAPLTRALATRLLGSYALKDPKHWMDTRVLGIHLIQGMAEKIPGAQAAFAQLIQNLPKYPELARAALAQMKTSENAVEAAEFGLELAIRCENIEAILGFLELASPPKVSWGRFAGDLGRIVARLCANGNKKLRRQAVRIERQVTRLRFDPDADWARLSGLAETEPDDTNRSLLVEALAVVLFDPPDLLESRLRWLLKLPGADGPETCEAVMKIFDDLANSHPAFIPILIDETFDLAFRNQPDGSILEHLSNPLFALYRSQDARLPGLAEQLIVRTASLSTQTCRKVSGKFRRLFAMIMPRMDRTMRDRLWAQVPTINRYFGRMIVEAVAGFETVDLSDKLKAVVENPKTPAEIVTLANRFLHRDLRAGGLERWPELYSLIG